MPLRGCSSRFPRWCFSTVILVVSHGGAPATAQSVVPRPLGAGLVVIQPTGDGSEGAKRTLDNPSGRLTLREALSLALRQSPELASFAWEVRAREAAAIQAGRPPNPVADLLFEDLGSSGRSLADQRAGQPQATLQVSQLIELGGKRAARRKLAETDRGLAEWDFETARIDVLSRVTTAFLDVLVSQQAIALAQRTSALIEQIDQTVRSRVEAGVVSPIEQTKAGVALAMARIEEQRARFALAADRTTLATLWGADTAAFASAEGEVMPPAATPSFETLAQHVAQNPEVARWAAEMARRDAARALETARAIPDVTVSAGYRRFTSADSNAFVLGASIPLPLFDRNQAGIRAAAQRVAQAREAELATRLRITTSLAVVYRDLAAASDEARALATEVLPGARSAFAAIEEGYRLGRFGYLDVLDAQRTLVAAEIQHLRAQGNAQKAVIALERLIGLPLADASIPPVTRQQEQP